MGFPVNNFTMISALAKGIKGIGSFDFMEDYFYETLEEELSGFDLIAMIVHDPEMHSGFHNFLEDRFQDLHYSTGPHFLFFALVQPPRKWWDNYERRGLRSFYNLWKANTGEVYSEIYSIRQFNDSIADILGASDTREPFVLLFRGFREKEALIFRTSEDILLKQFSILANLSHYPETLTLDQISDSLPPGSFSTHRSYHFPVIDQLDTLVSVITFGTRAYQPEKVERHLGELSRSFLLEFQNQMSFVRKELTERAELDEDQLEIVYEVMGRLAHAMINLSGDKDMKPVSSLTEKLAGLFDDDSLRYLRTAFLLWASLDRFSLSGAEEEFDYAPVAIGFARAFENEINHSFAHFIREKLKIKLPDYFYKHQPGVNALLELQDGDESKTLNYNYKNKRNVVDGLDWSPLEIGKNLKALEGITDPGSMGSGIYEALSSKFNADELAILEREWRIIRDLRNNSAHPNKVSRNDIVTIEKAFTTLLESGIFNILARMKNEYRGDSIKYKMKEVKVIQDNQTTGFSSVFKEVEGLFEVARTLNSENSKFLSEIVNEYSRKINYLEEVDSLPMDDFLNLYRVLGSPPNIRDLAVPLFHHIVDNDLGYDEIRMLRIIDWHLRENKDLIAVYKQVARNKQKNNSIRGYCINRLRWSHTGDFIKFAEEDLQQFIDENRDNQEIIKEFLSDISWIHDEIENRQPMYSMIKSYLKESKIKTYGFNSDFLKHLKLKKY